MNSRPARLGLSKPRFPLNLLAIHSPTNLLLKNISFVAIYSDVLEGSEVLCKPGDRLGILDSGIEEPKSRLRRYVLSVIALVLFLAFVLWYNFRFFPEKRAAQRFFDALAAGDTARAYELWKPLPSYTMDRFWEDWGPSGYYGPVKSYRIQSVSRPEKGGNRVIVVAELGPSAPFPEDNDVQKNRRIKEVHIWVDSQDKSISFPP